jgi:hypothetical protein
MDTCSEPASLVDLATGSSFTRLDIGGATMTVEITEHPLRRLKGRAFVTLTDALVALVNDDRWGDLFGMWMNLPGGCELDVDDAELDRALEDIEECDEDWQDAARRRSDLFEAIPAADGAAGRWGLLVPLVANDVDLPWRLRLLVRADVLAASFQEVSASCGPKARTLSGVALAPTICKHTPAEWGRAKCRGCFRRWWVAEARKVGLPDG